MIKIILSIVSFILFNATSAQHLAAFNDRSNIFWAFEAGKFKKIEHNAIQSFQVGGILIAYVDGSQRLKIYRNGNIETLMQGNPIRYIATDYLLGYSLYEQLNVYDNGQKKVLSTQCDGYTVRDSLIVWHNRISRTVDVYYDGKTSRLVDGLIHSPLERYKVGDNTIAFVHSSTKQFFIYYLGHLEVFDNFAEQMIFEAGRDIVAYMDIRDQAFNVFFRGNVHEIETFRPKSFKVGDEILAYVDNLGRLKFFENGKVKTISTHEPKSYNVVDKVLVFEEQGFLKTYCNGQVYIVERYIPSTYKVDFNTIAYLDQSSFVKAFQNCKSNTISFQRVQEIDLIRDLIIFVEGSNRTKIYFNGQIYEH